MAPAVTTVEPVRSPVDAVDGSRSVQGQKHDEIAAIIRSAIDENRIDLYLQPVLTLRMMAAISSYFLPLTGPATVSAPTGHLTGSSSRDCWNAMTACGLGTFFLRH